MQGKQKGRYVCMYIQAHGTICDSRSVYPVYAANKRGPYLYSH